MLPTLFSDMFVNRSHVHNYLTGHAHNLRVFINHKTKLSEQLIRTELLYHNGIIYLLIQLPIAQYVPLNIN